MRRVMMIGVLAAVAAFGAAQSLRVGSQAPPLKVHRWLKGTPVVELGHGKVNVVEFWATWCGPCKQSIPHLTELAHKYKGKATFTGVSVYEDRKAKDEQFLKKVAAFVKEMGPEMDYNVGADGLDPVMAKTWMEAAGQNGIPTAFVVDGTGTIVWIGHPMDHLDEVVGEVIAGKFNAKAEAEQRAKAEAAAADYAAKFAPLTEAMQAQNFKEALLVIDKLEKDDPSLKSRLAPARLMAYVQLDDPRINDFSRSLSEGELKDSPEFLNQIAWYLVSDEPRVSKADSKLAVKIAERASQLSKNSDGQILDTLAFAYYRDQQYEKAIEVQKKAIEFAQKDGNIPAATLKEIKDRLTLFLKKGK